MADLSNLTPEQMMAIMRMGLLSDGAPEASGGGFKAGPVAGEVTGFTAGDRQALMGGGAASIPTEFGTLRLGGGGAYIDRATGNPEYSFSPSVSFEAGPLTARYGQAYTPGGMSQSFGGGLKLGDVALNYERGMPQNGPGVNNFNIAVPYNGMNFTAGMVRPDAGPTQYQGGVNIPGLLGGDFGLTGQYTPSTKDAAVYARYRRRF